MHKYILLSTINRYTYYTFNNNPIRNHQVTGNCLRHSFLYNTPGGSVGACIISHQQRDKLGLKQCMFDSEEFITLKILKTN